MSYRDPEPKPEAVDAAGIELYDLCSIGVQLAFGAMMVTSLATFVLWIIGSSEIDWLAEAFASSMKPSGQLPLDFIRIFLAGCALNGVGALFIRGLRILSDRLPWPRGNSA